MTNYTVPFLVPALGGGPFETMRRATLDLVTSTVNQLLHGEGSDRAHIDYMGCVHPGRQTTGEDYDGFVVTNWKQDNAHIVHHDSGSASTPRERRDGAHILSSWTAQEGSDVSCGTVQEEEIPSSLEPTPLLPGMCLTMCFATDCNQKSLHLGIKGLVRLGVAPSWQENPAAEHPLCMQVTAM